LVAGPHSLLRSTPRALRFSRFSAFSATSATSAVRGSITNAPGRGYLPATVAG